jgi:L-2,4-diaminobutyrate decarboxylase
LPEILARSNDLLHPRFIGHQCTTALPLAALQRRLRRRLLEKGNFYVVQAVLRGRTWLRCTLINPRTTIADLAALLAEIRKIASE